jgi:autotransporter-associated beta strand protein/uncharacterized repeat protein (TIGR03803 family)
MAFILAALMIGVSSAAEGQTYQVLATFTGSSGAFLGSDARGSLTLSGSTLYGMTGEGGIDGEGNIFSVNTNGSGFKNLLSFSGVNGQHPDGDLTLGGSTLYAMTVTGGTNGLGNVFSINTDGSGFKNLLSFNGTNGAEPISSLTLSGTTLYGMTTGINGSGDGTVFRIGTDGSGFQKLVSFSGTSGAYLGAQPGGDLTVNGSTIYGMTTGGGANGEGTIFRLNTDGTGFQTLFSFSGTNCSGSWGSLTLAGTTLYGMAGGGASDNGSIFSISTTGGSIKTLFTFSGSNGSGPNGSFTLCGSTLYGMTFAAGVGGAAGNIFSINTDGTRFQNLYTFGADGWGPLGSLVLGGNTLYGMTNAGGINDNGVVFSFTLPTATSTWARSSGGSWSNPGNWNANLVPGYNPLDAALFGTAIGTARATVTLDGSWILGGLSFSTTGGGSYTLSRSAGDTTSTLTLTSTGANAALTNNGGNHTIAVPVILGSNLSVSATPGSNLTVSGAISESNPGTSVTLTGNGQLILAGSNTYTGGTVVEAGILVAANGRNGSATGSGTVTLSGGTLASGDEGGTIAGEVEIGPLPSVIAPGGIGAIGTLTIGSLLTSSNLTLDFDLTTPDGSGDLLIITSALTVGPDTPILFGTDPTAFGDYPLIAIPGDFDTSALGNFDLSTAPDGDAYSLTAIGGYIDLVVAVPEPSTLVLLGVAAIGLLGAAWQRGRRRSGPATLYPV